MIAVDTLVRGTAGVTARIITGRVYRVLRSGVAVITDEGQQAIIYHPEEIGAPRPATRRTDIPRRLQ